MFNLQKASLLQQEAAAAYQAAVYWRALMQDSQSLYHYRRYADRVSANLDRAAAYSAGARKLLGIE